MTSKKPSVEQLRSAAIHFLGEEIPSPTVAPYDPLPQSCREAQNALRAATQSCRDALRWSRTINLVEKAAAGKQARGQRTESSHDGLRAALSFASAGLDIALKRLVEDTLGFLAEEDEQVNKKLKSFAESSIGKDGEINAASLVEILLGQGLSPRDIIVRRWISTLTASSAQSAERVNEISQALGVTDESIRRRTNPTPSKNKLLEKAFTARNKIIHELDLTQPKSDTRARLENIRRRQDPKEIQQWCFECIEVGQLILNDVARRIDIISS
ncbi:hypothetical protein ACFYVD_01960 [Rhodococcus pyridinivorans]|uniref:hypothetical protein n=1 Tax=Rhodococcus pyridinivorans TaxID=103816 RepID=UPI0036B1A9B1